MKKLFGMACMALMASSVQAQSFRSADDAVLYRQSAFQVLSAHIGRLRPVVSDQVPYNADAVEEVADVIETLAALPWAGFGPGTEGGNSKKTVWSDHKAFEKERQQFIVRVNALKEAADQGDLAQLKKSFKDVTQSCRTCHDNFKYKH